MERMKYQEQARQARLKVLDLIFKAQTSHIGSNFSAIDIMTVLFEKADPKKDEVILSAGWKAAAWYYFLHKKGVISEEELNSFCQPGSPFIGLVEPMNRWGLKSAGGSMGCGLPFAVGFALAKKLKGEEGKVYCLMSDGEMAIGTTWESALIAAQHQLDNLVVIVDNNGFQAMGKTDAILKVNSWLFLHAIDWCTTEINGHDVNQIENNLIYNTEHKQHHSNHKMPKIVIANTVKGKGVSFIEGNNLYHYKAPDESEYQLAMRELNV